MADEEKWTIGVGQAVSSANLVLVYEQFFKVPALAPALWVRQAVKKLEGADEAAVRAAGLKAPGPNEQHIACQVCVVVIRYCIGLAVTTDGEAGGFLNDIQENRLPQDDWEVLRHLAMRELRRIPGFESHIQPDRMAAFLHSLTFMIRAAADIIVNKALPLVQNRKG